MRPLSYLLMVTLALATGGEAVVHGNRNGYRYNGPSHKYLPAKGAPSTDAITTTGHWRPQVLDEREREQQLSSRPGHGQQQQGGQQETIFQHGYRQEQQRVPSYGHYQQSLQEVEYVIQQQRPQGFSQYQGNRQIESSLGQQQQQGYYQQQQPENPWDSIYNQQQQQGPIQYQGSQEHQQQHPVNHLYSHQQQESRPHQGQQNRLESAYGQQQHGSNQHNQLFNQEKEGSHQQQLENNWGSFYGHQQHGANNQQGSHQQPENHWSPSVSHHQSEGSRWQTQPSISPYPLEPLDSLPFAHAHANSQKTLARPSNHINHIPGYTLSSNPEHERFIGLDADDNRLITQSLPFQSPSAPFRPTNHPLQQQDRPSLIEKDQSNFLQMQSQSYELPQTHHIQSGWVASAQSNSHPNQPNRQFQPPYY